MSELKDLSEESLEKAVIELGKLLAERGVKLSITPSFAILKTEKEEDVSSPHDKELMLYALNNHWPQNLYSDDAPIEIFCPLEQVEAKKLIYGPKYRVRAVEKITPSVKIRALRRFLHVNDGHKYMAVDIQRLIDTEREKITEK